jgi:nucleoside-diphosphate-sugar epimerase
LLPDIIEQLDQDVVKLGNLLPRRDYIYVDDVANAILHLMDESVPSAAYNVGCEEAHSAQDVVDTIGECLGRTLRIDSVPERQRAGDRPVLQSNCAKLRGHGWYPRYDLRTALDATLKFYGKI